MTTVKIRNNTVGVNINIDRMGNITIQGSSITVQSTAHESVMEDAPTNSMTAQAIAGGRDGDQPPVRNNKSKAIIASMLRRKMKEQK